MLHLLAEVQHPEGLKKDGEFYTAFSWNSKPKTKILFMLKFVTNSCSPINSISSPLESHKSGSKIIIKLTKKNCWRKIFFSFNFVFQRSCLQVLLPSMLRYFQAHSLVLPIIPRARCLWKKHRANMAWLTTASHTIHKRTKNMTSCFHF